MNSGIAFQRLLHTSVMAALMDSVLLATERLGLARDDR
jgi:hypothetical protein